MKIILAILISIILSPIYCQDWMSKLAYQNQLISKIENGDSWEKIYDYGTNDIKIDSSFLSDINDAILFVSNFNGKTIIDTFFLDISKSKFSDFPYRNSGYLRNELYIEYKPDISEVEIFIRNQHGKSLYPQFSKIVNLSQEKSIPKLIDYLKNDASTRLVIKAIDLSETSYFLSISDIAMELIEVISYCDFFDNASHSEMLFSNLSDDEKSKIVKNIELWFDKSKKLSEFGAIEFFLDSICEIGYSYRYTCNNILYHGNTSLAKKKYQKLYEESNLPCRNDIEVGKILLELNDNRVIEDCLNKSINYRCMADNGANCIDIFLFSNGVNYRDEILAEIVSTERHSRNRKKGTGPGYIWHKIFGEMADYSKYKLPLTLIELMKINSDFKSINSYSKHKWEFNFKDEILSGFRICDLALLKYNATIEKIGITDWKNQKERDQKINEILNKFEGNGSDKK